MITAQEIGKIAALAHLEITSDETELYAKQMSEIVAYIAQLNELDTADVAAATGGLTDENMSTDVTRPDEIRPSLGQETALREAPSHADGFFRVPKVL